MAKTSNKKTTISSDRKFKRAILFIFFIFLFSLPLFLKQTKDIIDNSKKLEELRNKNQKVEDKLASLKWEDNNKEKPVFYEKIARYKLKMVKPSDIIYYDKAQDIKKDLKDNKGKNN